MPGMPPRSLNLSRQHFNQIVTHLQTVLPAEGCGLLAGSAGMTRRVVPIDNVLQSGARFRMDPEQQVAAMESIREDGLKVVGIFHSHPEGPGQPSPSDVHEAAYPEAVYLIFWPQGSDWSVRGYSIANGETIEVEVFIG